VSRSNFLIYNTHGFAENRSRVIRELDGAVQVQLHMDSDHPGEAFSLLTELRLGQAVRRHESQLGRVTLKVTRNAGGQDGRKMHGGLAVEWKSGGRMELEEEGKDIYSLAPSGMALLGRRGGDQCPWRLPGGGIRPEVHKVENFFPTEEEKEP